MNVTDQRYFKRWLNELGELNPEKLWQELVATNELPVIDFSNAVSAVYATKYRRKPD